MRLLVSCSNFTFSSRILVSSSSWRVNLSIYSVKSSCWPSNSELVYSSLCLFESPLTNLAFKSKISWLSVCSSRSLSCERVSIYCWASWSSLFTSSSSLFISFSFCWCSNSAYSSLLCVLTWLNWRSSHLRLVSFNLLSISLILESSTLRFSASSF